MSNTVPGLGSGCEARQHADQVVPDGDGGLPQLQYEDMDILFRTRCAFICYHPMARGRYRRSSWRTKSMQSVHVEQSVMLRSCKRKESAEADVCLKRKQYRQAHRATPEAPTNPRRCCVVSCQSVGAELDVAVQTNGLHCFGNNLASWWVTKCEKPSIQI